MAATTKADLALGEDVLAYSRGTLSHGRESLGPMLDPLPLALEDCLRERCDRLDVAFRGGF